MSQRTATLLISGHAKLIIGRSFEHRTRRFVGSRRTKWVRSFLSARQQGSKCLLAWKWIRARLPTYRVFAGHSLSPLSQTSSTFRRDRLAGGRRASNRRDRVKRNCHPLAQGLLLRSTAQPITVYVVAQRKRPCAHPRRSPDKASREQGRGTGVGCLTGTGSHCYSPDLRGLCRPTSEQSQAGSLNLRIEAVQLCYGGLPLDRVSPCGRYSPWPGQPLLPPYSRVAALHR